jgi:hypothetical protein
LPKSLLLNQINRLFTPEYKLLLQGYALPTNWDKENLSKYYSITIEQKRYSAYISMDENNVVSYTMSRQRNAEYESFIDLHLKFRKTELGIKLYEVEGSYVSISE